MVEFQNNKWKLLSFGLIGIIALGAILPTATAASDTTQLTQQILNTVKDIQTKVNALTTNEASVLSAIAGVQSYTNDIQSNLGKIKHHAVTVSVSLPEEGDLEILPLENVNNTMYAGHVNGIMSISGVANTGVRLNCALTLANAPIQQIARIDSEAGQFKSLELDEDFSCTSLTLQIVGEHTDQIIADLAISYDEIEGIQEIENS